MDTSKETEASTREREESPEFREKQGDRIVEFLDRIHAEEVFGSEETKREFIESLEYPQFKEWLVRMNGFLREISIKDRKMDGETVFMRGVIDDNDCPPQYRDREKLFEDVLTNLQKMNHSGRSTEDLALLLSSAINAIHPFANVNGRTSRLSYILLSGEFDDGREEVIREALTDRKAVIDVDPSILDTHEITPLLEERLDLQDKGEKVRGFRGLTQIEEVENEFKERGFTSEDCVFMDQAVLGHGRDGDGFLAVGAVLKEKGKLKQCLDSFNSEYLFISTSLLVKHITKEDLEEIKNKFWEIKVEKVKILMDMIVAPAKYPSKKESGKLALDVFKEEMAKG